jgi:hypothetical protein
MSARLPLLACVLALAACERPAIAPGAPPPGGGATVDVAEPTPVLPIDHPPLEEETGPGTRSAQVRRLTLPQVRQSLAAVLGNDVNGAPITWMVSTTVTGFDRYGGALGQADFLNITEDAVEPSALYAKFMGDAARDACNRALAADKDRTNPTDRVMTRFVEQTDTVAKNPEGIDRNLRYLKLRFHGVKVPDDDVERISGLRTLFDTAVKKASSNAANPSQAQVRVGWHVVCVGLLTDPEFHLY